MNEAVGEQPQRPCYCVVGLQMDVCMGGPGRLHSNLFEPKMLQTQLIFPHLIIRRYCRLEFKGYIKCQRKARVLFAKLHA